MSNANEYPKIIEALHYIPPTVQREKWVQIGMALHSSGCDFEVFDVWSAPADNYKAAECRSTWQSFKHHKKGIGDATLFKIAKENGWIEPTLDTLATAYWMLGLLNSRVFIEAGSPQLDRRAWDDLTLKSILRVLFVD